MSTYECHLSNKWQICVVYKKEETECRDKEDRGLNTEIQRQQLKERDVKLGGGRLK